MDPEFATAKRSVLFLSLALGLGLVVGLLWLTVEVRADGDVLFVTPDGVESGACDSWMAPCDLQYALGEAEAGDEIWVAQGFYTPTHPTTPRDGTFILKEGVALYGGFEGDETSRGERDWETYKSVLSGDITGDDTTDPNGVVTDVTGIVTPNVYHVVTSVDVTETAELDGFVITAGYAETGREGGGLYNHGAGPTLRNLLFQGNYGTKGGGMATIDQGSPILDHVEFIGNVAELAGGGLYNKESLVDLTDVTFRSNAAADGGGMHNAFKVKLSFVGGSFVGNKATGGHGGGMFTSAGNVSATTLISVTDVVFLRNWANSTGGGMANRLQARTILVNVGFYGNRVDNGGGAGMHSNNGSHPTLHNVVFVGNSAEINGGAMHHQGGCYPVLINVTMVDNEVRNGPGGGMYNQGSYPVISNTIIGRNTITSTATGEQIFNTPNSTPTIAYSDIQGAFNPGWDTSLGIDGGGNMEDYPGFVSAPDPGGDGVWGTVDDDYGNLRLGPLSPVRNKGDNDSVPPDILDVDGDGNTEEQLPWDYDKTARIAGGVVDMGVYENAAILIITKTVAGPGTGPQNAVELAQGDAVTYTLRFRNNGTYSATGVVLTDVIPASIVDTQVISFGPPITPVASTRYVWEVAPIPPNRGGVLTVTGMLSGCVPADHQVVNTATISSPDAALSPVATATITATNRAPLAADDAYTVTEGTVLTVAAPGVLDNDSDPDCDDLTATVVAPPVSGTLELALDGSLAYTPEVDFVGEVTFTYEASDGALTDTATVTVTVEEGLYTVFLPVVLKNE